MTDVESTDTPMEQVLMGVQNQDIWQDMEEFWKGLGGAGQQAFLVRITSVQDKFYEWLKHSLGEAQPVEHSTQHVNILSVPSGIGCDVGTRNCSVASLTAIWKTLTLQGEWRSYDRILLCRLANEQEELFFYVKVHHRVVALRMLCAFYHSTGRQLPQQFLTMARRIPIEYLGKLERKDAVARGLGLTVSMQQCVKTHWVDLMSQIKSDPNFGNQLHAAFIQICPEHKEQISD